MNDDIERMKQRDLERFRNYSGGGGMDTSLPALVELAFGSLAATAALCWMLTLYWVPDTIPGQVWMGVGLLALGVTAAPAGLVYWLRRGGSDVVLTLMRDIAG